MKNTSRPSMHSARKARIYPLRSEILRRVADGQSICFIQSALGLDDVPRSSFYENVKKLQLTHHAAHAPMHVPMPTGFSRSETTEAQVRKRAEQPDPERGEKAGTAPRRYKKPLRIGAMNAANLPPTTSNPRNRGL